MSTGIFWLDGWPRVAWHGHDVTFSCVYLGIAVLWLGVAALTFYGETHRHQFAAPLAAEGKEEE